MALVDLTVARPPVVDTDAQAVATIAALRTTEPSADGQMMTVEEYASGTGTGGGQFRGMLDGSAYTDNQGTIIKTSGGAVWLRQNATVMDPLMFGAVGDGVTDDTAALRRVQVLAGCTVDFLGRTYYTTGDLDFKGSSPSTFRNGTLKPSAAVANVARVHNAAHILDGLNIDAKLTTSAIGYNVDVSCEGIRISNCTIERTGRPGVVNNASHAIFDNLTLTSCGLTGTSPFNNAMYMVANQYTTVQNCTLNTCYWGIYWRTDLAATKTLGNKLLNCRISGKGQTADANAQGVSCQNNNYLEVAGCVISDFPNNAVDLQYSDYCHIHDNKMVACSDGIFIGDRSCRGHNLHNNTMLDCVRGLRFYCVDSVLVGQFYDIRFAGNTIVNATDKAISVVLTAASAVSNCSIDSNIVNQQGVGTGTHAIEINGLSVSSVSGNLVKGARQAGIYVTGSDLLRMQGNTIQDASRANVGAYAGIVLTGSSARVVVSDSIVYGSASYAVQVDSGTSACTIKGTRWRSTATGGIQNSGTSTTVSDNIAF